ncbi:MAG: NUDIX hydrolase [Gammaproteobacteria bacterium]|nr:NUDIX hydrolase [Gammaproteobacteria bacterium]
MSTSAPEHIRYCALCAGNMHTQPRAGKPRRVCVECGFIHFIEAKVAVGGLALDGDRVLLVKRAKPPEKGKWCLPAGYLDYGEDPREAAARELLEETHLQVQVNEIFDVYFNPVSDPSQPGASALILYAVEVAGGTLRADDDASDAQFFDLNALPELAFESTHQAIAKLRASTDD